MLHVGDRHVICGLCRFWCRLMCWSMRVLGSEGDLLQVLEAGVGAIGLADSAGVGFSRTRWSGG
jgi:hypothetical protein